jgi:hypothetical protein
MKFSTLTHTESKDSPTDFYQFLALAFGMFGFIMRQVWSSWAGVLLLICSIRSCKFSSFDYSQVISSGLMIVMSLAANYFRFFRSPFDQSA